MNMKDQFNKIMETLKTTANKTAITFSVIENNFKDITQKIKADLQKAEAAKSAETPPPPPTGAVQTTEQSTPSAQATKKEGDPKPG